MSNIFPHESRNDILNRIYRDRYSGMTLVLFTTTSVPDDTWNVSTLSQPTFPGYAPIALSTFNNAFTNGADHGEIQATSLVTFVASADVIPSQSVYGYALLDVDTASNPIIRHLEPLPGGPFVFALMGDTLQILIDVEDGPLP